MKNMNRWPFANAALAAGLLLGPLSIVTACDSPGAGPEVTATQGDQYDKYRRKAADGEVCITYLVSKVAGYGGEPNVDRQTLNWNAVAIAGLHVDRSKWTGSQTAANDNADRIITVQNAWAKKIGTGLADNSSAPRPEDIITIGLDFTNPDKINDGGDLFAITEGTIGVVPYSDQKIPKWVESGTGVHKVDCNTLKPVDKTLPGAGQPIESLLPNEGKPPGE